ncbi:phage protein [Escherichia coli]|nr:phage protein [Escherichia coli]
MPMMRPALALARLILTNPQITMENINAPLASVTMKDTAWQVNKQSVAKSLTLNGSTLSFNRFGEGGLTSDTLEATNSSFIINADGKQQIR